MNIFIKPIVLFVFVLFSSNSSGSVLLDMANDGPRIFKTTTVVDCRSMSTVMDNTVNLYVIDITNKKIDHWVQEVSPRDWSIFEYDMRGYREDRKTKKIYDVYEDKSGDLFFTYRSEYILFSDLKFDAAEETLTTNGYYLSRYAKYTCRYL